MVFIITFERFQTLKIFHEKNSFLSPLLFGGDWLPKLTVQVLVKYNLALKPLTNWGYDFSIFLSSSRTLTPSFSTHLVSGSNCFSSSKSGCKWENHVWPACSFSNGHELYYLSKLLLDTLQISKCFYRGRYFLTVILMHIKLSLNTRSCQKIIYYFKKCFAWIYFWIFSNISPSSLSFFNYLKLSIAK